MEKEQMPDFGKLNKNVSRDIWWGGTEPYNKKSLWYLPSGKLGIYSSELNEWQFIDFPYIINAGDPLSWDDNNLIDLQDLKPLFFTQDDTAYIIISVNGISYTLTYDPAWKQFVGGSFLIKYDDTIDKVMLGYGPV